MEYIEADNLFHLLRAAEDSGRPCPIVRKVFAYNRVQHELKALPRRAAGHPLSKDEGFLHEAN